MPHPPIIVITSLLDNAAPSWIFNILDSLKDYDTLAIDFSEDMSTDDYINMISGASATGRKQLSKTDPWVTQLKKDPSSAITIPSNIASALDLRGYSFFLLGMIKLLQRIRKRPISLCGIDVPEAQLMNTEPDIRHRYMAENMKKLIKEKNGRVIILLSNTHFAASYHLDDVGIAREDCIYVDLYNPNQPFWHSDTLRIQHRTELLSEKKLRKDEFPPNNYFYMEVTSTTETASLNFLILQRIKEIIIAHETAEANRITETTLPSAAAPSVNKSTSSTMMANFDPLIVQRIRDQIAANLAAGANHVADASSPAAAAAPAEEAKPAPVAVAKLGKNAKKKQNKSTLVGPMTTFGSQSMTLTSAVDNASAGVANTNAVVIP